MILCILAFFDWIHGNFIKLIFTNKKEQVKSLSLLTMMHLHTYSFFICLIFNGALYAQLGQTEIHADVRIEALIKKEGAAVPPANQPQINGYRVQLLFESERKKVENARSEFVSMYPKIDSYVQFSAPNFILKVGDFRTYLEAEAIRDQLFQEFPTGFILKEPVNLPRVDQ